VAQLLCAIWIRHHFPINISSFESIHDNRNTGVVYASREDGLNLWHHILEFWNGEISRQGKHVRGCLHADASFNIGQREENRVHLSITRADRQWCFVGCGNHTKQGVPLGYVTLRTSAISQSPNSNKCCTYHIIPGKVHAHEFTIYPLICIRINESISVKLHAICENRV